LDFENNFLQPTGIFLEPAQEKQTLEINPRKLSKHAWAMRICFRFQGTKISFYPINGKVK
jgi:hypothetical protein